MAPDGSFGAGDHERGRSRANTGQAGGSGPSSFGDLSRYALSQPIPPIWPSSRPHTAPERDSAAISAPIDPYNVLRHSPRLPTVPAPLQIAPFDRRPATSLTANARVPILPPPIYAAHGQGHGQAAGSWPQTPGGSRYDPPTSTQPLMSPVSPFHTRPTTSSSLAYSEYARPQSAPFVPTSSRPPAVRSRTATAPTGQTEPAAGFQADYPRTGRLRAPSAPIGGFHTGGVPLESLMAVRFGDAPAKGARDIRGPAERWTWALEIIQEPLIGQALDFDDLSADFPRLIPPLIAKLVVRDDSGDVLQAENPKLQSLVTHLITQVMLVSSTGSPREQIAGRARSLSAPETDKPVVYDTMPGALRSAAAQLYRFQGRPEWLFLFSDLVVRPRGQFQLEVVLMNVRAPGPNGTSTGVTRVLARAVTEPFDNLPAATYAQAELAIPRPTELSRDLGRQGAEELLDGPGAA